MQHFEITFSHYHFHGPRSQSYKNHELPLTLNSRSIQFKTRISTLCQIGVRTHRIKVSCCSNTVFRLVPAMINATHSLISTHWFQQRVTRPDTVVDKERTWEGIQSEVIWSFCSMDFVITWAWVLLMQAEFSFTQVGMLHMLILNNNFWYPKLFTIHILILQAFIVKNVLYIS